MYPSAHIQLVAILSAQTTDRKVKIEHDVTRLLPRREWTAASHRVIWHGRRVCHARRPACGVARWCPSFGTARPARRPRARQDQSLFVTGPGCWCAL